MDENIDSKNPIVIIQVNKKTCLSRKGFAGCRISGAKGKETTYSTVTVGFDWILQPTALHLHIKKHVCKM